MEQVLTRPCSWEGSFVGQSPPPRKNPINVFLEMYATGLPVCMRVLLAKPSPLLRKWSKVYAIGLHHFHKRGTTVIFTFVTDLVFVKGHIVENDHEPCHFRGAHTSVLLSYTCYSRSWLSPRPALSLNPDRAQAACPLPSIAV